MLYLDNKQYSKALTTLKAVLELKKAKLPPHDASIIVTMGNVAVCCSRMEQYQEAADLYRRVVEAKRKREPPNPVSLVSKLAGLATCLVKLGKFEEAESAARESVTIRQKEMPDHWLLFNSKSLFGTSLAGQKKYAEAEPLLLEGYAGIKSRREQVPANALFRIAEALQRIIDLYDAWDET